MPTPLELELLAMVAEERRRNASAEQPQAASPLPDLTPEMLMSASARREVEAARGWNGRPTGVAAAVSNAVERQTRQANEFRPYRPTPIDRGASDFFDTDMGEIDLDNEGGVPTVTANDEQILGALFMGREAQDAASVLEGGGGYSGGSARRGFDIEFDADSMLEGRTAPNEAARWQVGRQDPPRMPFSAVRVEGPSDGVVVRSRENGAWQRSAATPRPEARPGARLAAIREQATRPPSAQSAPMSSPRPAQKPYMGPRPTVYDRIMRGGVIDDD